MSNQRRVVDNLHRFELNAPISSDAKVFIQLLQDGLENSINPNFLLMVTMHTILPARMKDQQHLNNQEP